MSMPSRRDPPREAAAPTPSSDQPSRPEVFLDGLHDADPQVRLNAAVRLAYLGRADGLEALLEGLAHESFAIRFNQVPDALARLGGAGADRLERLVGRSGPDGASVRGFRLGVDFVALASRPFVDATVYVLPRDTFSQMGEWTSLVPVRPLASTAIAPEDFPLLEELWGTDLGPLASQFTDEHPGLQDIGFWASKRSARSAHA